MPRVHYTVVMKMKFSSGPQMNPKRP